LDFLGHYSGWLCPQSIWRVVGQWSAKRLQHKVDYGNFMKPYQFQQIWEVVMHMWASPEQKKDDGWWMINLAIDEFNMN